MASVIISLKDDSRLYTYNSIMKSIRSDIRKDTSYRCYPSFEMRIDIMPNTKYHKTYFITDKLLENIKSEIKLDKTPKTRSRNLSYGILIADALKGYSAPKGFFYNAIATQKYLKDYILDTATFTISKGIAKCIPAGSEIASYSTAMFNENDLDTHTIIRRILGINNGKFDIQSFMDEYNLYHNKSYVGSCYFDDGKITVSELYEIAEVII